MALPPTYPRPWTVQSPPTRTISDADDDGRLSTHQDSSRLRILPVAVIGSSSTNSTMRGYL